MAAIAAMSNTSAFTQQTLYVSALGVCVLSTGAN